MGNVTSPTVGIASSKNNVLLKLGRHKRLGTSRLAGVENRAEERMNLGGPSSILIQQSLLSPVVLRPDTWPKEKFCRNSSTVPFPGVISNRAASSWTTHRFRQEFSQRFNPCFAARLVIFAALPNLICQVLTGHEALAFLSHVCRG